MLVLPVGGTVAYIQPVFLTARGNAITELAGVIVVNGEHVVMGRTLDEAIGGAYRSGASSITISGRPLGQNLV